LPGFLPYTHAGSASKWAVGYGLLLSFFVLSLTPIGCAQYRQTVLNITPANDYPDFSQVCQNIVLGLAET